MTINLFLILLSGISFLLYGISYFITPQMKTEFRRFGLEKLGLLTIIFEMSGAIGLLVGLWFTPLLIFSSLGLAILMLLGVLVRIKMKDSFIVTFPALFFLLLNAYIFYHTISSI